MSSPPFSHLVTNFWPPPTTSSSSFSFKSSLHLHHILLPPSSLSPSLIPLTPQLFLINPHSCSLSLHQHFHNNLFFSSPHHVPTLVIISPFSSSLHYHLIFTLSLFLPIIPASPHDHPSTLIISSPGAHLLLIFQAPLHHLIITSLPSSSSH